MKPFAFQWHITDSCDQRCKHCYIYSGGKAHLTEMSWERIEKTLSNCLDFCSHFERSPYFYITGGDPILHPDFFKLLEKLHEQNIPFGILGNPYHLDDAVCRRLKALGCKSYQLSLDGLKETHDWFRKPGSFETTLEKVNVINNAGITSVIMTTVSAENYREIPELIDTVVEAGAGVFAFSRYVPSGGEVSSLTSREYRKLLKRCEGIFKSYEARGCPTFFNRKDHLWKLLEYEQGEFEIPADSREDIIYDGCNCGNAHLTILPTGEVMACRRVEGSVVGDISEPLTEIWTGAMEAYRDYERFEKCSDCELLAWCRGCPAVAFGTYGNFYAPDPQCWK